MSVFDVMMGASNVSKFCVLLGKAPPSCTFRSTAFTVKSFDDVDWLSGDVLHSIDVFDTYATLHAALPSEERYTVGDVSDVPNVVPKTVIVNPPLIGVLYTFTPVIVCALTLLDDAKSFKTTQRNRNFRAMPASVAIVQ